MHRRAFLGIFSLLAVPRSVQAQPAGKVARVGILSAGPAFPRDESFRQGLHALGYVEGQNVVIVARYAEGHNEKLPGLAAELVGLKVDVIVAAPIPAVRAAQQATRTIPIVMAYAGDPIGEGFASGLARPGGNVTGLSGMLVETQTKRVEYLKVVVPKLSRVAFLGPAEVARTAVTATESAARTLGLQVIAMSVRNAHELSEAFSTMRDARVAGVVVTLGLQVHFKQIAELALKSRLPSVSGPREFVEAGGLMAYGPNIHDLSRRAATYVDKILKGAKPAELPIEQASKFDLGINLKTAKALGLTIPSSLLQRADQVIE